jgi:hypothetical protein
MKVRHGGKWEEEVVGSKKKELRTPVFGLPTKDLIK